MRNSDAANGDGIRAFSYICCAWQSAGILWVDDLRQWHYEYTLVSTLW